MMIGNMAAGMISIQFGAKGPNLSIATACAAGAHAVGDSFKVIQQGIADAMITGGVEAVVNPTCVAGFNAMKALSTRNDDPKGFPALRPRPGRFCGGRRKWHSDSGSHGPGSGTRCPHLCRNRWLRHERRRVSHDRAATGRKRRCALYANALDDARMGPIRLTTSMPMEHRPNSTIFMKPGRLRPCLKHAYKLAISSTKSMTGHLLGGAGGIETVFTALTVHNDIIPPTINMRTHLRNVIWIMSRIRS